MRKKMVIVKKCKSHRVGIVVFCVLMLAVLTTCVLAIRTPAAVLLYIPVLIPLSFLVLYYLTWQIRFEENDIIRSVFLSKARRYSYTMIQEVVESCYTSERNYTIRMYFRDGKMFHFRMDDENAMQAIKRLQGHCSIKRS